MNDVSDTNIEETTIANGKRHHWLDRFFTNCYGRVISYPGSGIGYVGDMLTVYGGSAFRFPAQICFATEEEAASDLERRKAHP